MAEPHNLEAPIGVLAADLLGWFGVGDDCARLLMGGPMMGQPLPSLQVPIVKGTNGILALSLPPWAPWWIGVIGGGFAVVVGKHIFGGIGQNLFNPAMLARVMPLVSFPVEMTTWLEPRPWFSATTPSFLEGLRITFGGSPMADGVTGATLLGHLRTELGC